MILSKAKFSRWAAGLSFLATLSLHEYPKTPKAPEAIPISMYVWNTTTAPRNVTVIIQEEEKFSQKIPAGQGIGVQNFVELLPGQHEIRAISEGLDQSTSIQIAPSGPAWLVVICWDKEIEIKMQQQPPWVSAQQQG